MGRGSIVFSTLLTTTAVLFSADCYAQTPPPAKQPPALDQKTQDQVREMQQMKQQLPEPAKQGPKPKKEKKTEVAFFNLEANVISAGVANIISDAILVDLGKIPQISVISSKEIDTMLGYEQKKQLAGCTDTGCMVAIGGALGVDKILNGSVGKIGSSYTFNLKLLDIQNAKIEKMYDKRLKGGSEEDILDLIPEALSAIFPENRALWSSQAKKPGGEQQGKADSAPQGVGQPGKSEKKAAAVTAGSVGPWVLIGTGIAAVAGGGVSHILAYTDYQTYRDLPDSEVQRISDLKSRITSEQIAAYTLYGVGGAMIIGGVIWKVLYDRAPAKKRTSGLDIRLEPFAQAGAAVAGSW